MTPDKWMGIIWAVLWSGVLIGFVAGSLCKPDDSTGLRSDENSDRDGGAS
jgi:hypothetical protein